MIEIRPYKSLGQANYGWLLARYHFSFGSYLNPMRMGWGKLRVWNDDLIAPHKGFPPHPHENMEIITFVRKGAITHRDSLGNQGRTPAGHIQVMSAGSGIRHSEYNLEDEETTLFQIWIETDARDITPAWDHKKFMEMPEKGDFQILASGFAEDTEALKIHTDSRILGLHLGKAQKAQYQFKPDRLGYLVVSQGEITLNGLILSKGDGAAIKAEKTLSFEGMADSEIILVDTSP